MSELLGVVAGIIATVFLAKFIGAQAERKKIIESQNATILKKDLVIGDLQKEIQRTKEAANTKTAPVDEGKKKEQAVLEPFPAGERQISLPLPKKATIPSRPSTFKDRKPLNFLLEEWSEVSGIDLKSLKKKLRAYAGVPQINYMSYPQVLEACEWIRQEIEALKKKD